MYAIIETGGKQLKVEKGQEIYVEKLEIADGAIYTFESVLAISDESLTLGSPYIKGASVTAKAVKQGKGKKITIFKYRQRNGSTRRKQGHRQPYTKLVVEKISLSAPVKETTTKSPVKKESTPVTKEVKAKKEKSDDKGTVAKK